MKPTMPLHTYSDVESKVTIRRRIRDKEPHVLVFNDDGSVQEPWFTIGTWPREGRRPCGRLFGGGSRCGRHDGNAYDQ